jgi:hypothetical protein
MDRPISSATVARAISGRVNSHRLPGGESSHGADDRSSLFSRGSVSTSLGAPTSAATSSRPANANLNTSSSRE